MLKESIDLADQGMTSVRTQSYLLYPPFLEEAGLVSALKWYAKGFAERGGIAIALDLPESFDCLPQDVEAALFRVVQKALINAHRHANSADATIRLRREGDAIILEVDDDGRGMAADALARPTSSSASTPGIGIAGTRERLEQLGGRLEIESSSRGHDDPRDQSAETPLFDNVSGII